MKILNTNTEAGPRLQKLFDVTFRLFTEGYRAYETYSSHIVSPGYTASPRSYPPNTYREYQIKDQITHQAGMLGSSLGSQ